MAIILDADVLIRAEKGLFDIHRWFAFRPNDRFEIAAITIAELWHGVERGTEQNRIKRERILQSILIHYLSSPTQSRLLTNMRDSGPSLRWRAK